MQQLTFNIQRSAYDPQPTRSVAITAKHEILTNGGEFFMMSVNGCTSPVTLVEHVVSEFNIPLPVVEQALESLANATIEEYAGVVCDTWAVAEEEPKRNEEITKFVAFAYSPEEIELKTALFVSGMRQFKAIISAFLEKREYNQVWVAPVAEILV